MIEIQREPDYAGTARAWKMKMGPQARPEQQAALEGYIVHGPYHPFWSWWMVSVIHLRDIEGTPPATKHYPEAEYEFMIMSVDPQGKSPDPDETFPQDVGYLDPPDCVVQFDGVTDEQAKSILRDAVRLIAKGMSCDSDYRKWWESAIHATVDHYRQGLH